MDLSHDQTPWDIWRQAATGAADAALRDLYAQVEKQIQDRQPQCLLSGRCCDFNAFGHRLYVTGLEIAWFLQQTTRFNTLPVRIDLHGPCVFQVRGLCTVHAFRPLGCRLFFCQQGTQEWQHAQYEHFQGRLCRLHDQLAVPYRYMEWRAGLHEALQAQPPSQA